MRLRFRSPIYRQQSASEALRQLVLALDARYLADLNRWVRSRSDAWPESFKRLLDSQGIDIHKARDALRGLTLSNLRDAVATYRAHGNDTAGALAELRTLGLGSTPILQIVMRLGNSGAEF